MNLLYTTTIVRHNDHMSVQREACKSFLFYNLHILEKKFDIPFHIAAQDSTSQDNLDLSVRWNLQLQILIELIYAYTNTLGLLLRWDWKSKVL